MALRYPTQRKEDLGKPIVPSGKTKPKGKDAETKSPKDNVRSMVRRYKAPKNYMSSSDGVVKV